MSEMVWYEKGLNVTVELDQTLPTDVFAGIPGLRQAEHRKTSNGLIRLASNQDVTCQFPEYRRNQNSHRIAVARMNSTKKSKVKTDTASSSVTMSGASSGVFTATVAIVRDEWKEMIGFAVRYMESDASDAQTIFVDEERMLLGYTNAEGKPQEMAMRFFHFSNWLNIPGRIIVSDDLRIRRNVDGQDKSFVSGFTFIADTPLTDANYLGLRMVEGMFMPEGEGYFVVKGDDIVIEQFDTAYYFITPHSESREITAIKDEIWVFPVIYAFYIASGNNKFPEYKYREGIQGLTQWCQMKGVPVIDLLKHLWAQGPRRWMPLYHGLVRVFSQLKLIDVEKRIYEFFKCHEEPSARIFSVRLLGALKTGIAVQYLERTIKPELSKDDPIIKEIDRQLEGIMLLSSNQMKGYAPIVGLTRVADDVISSLKSWLQLGDRFVPFWARDYAQLTRNMLIPDQKRFDLGDSRVMGHSCTRFEQDFKIEGHSFTTRFTPDVDTHAFTIALLENPADERPVHHKFGSLQLMLADDGQWHITAMQLIRLDHVFVNTLKHVLLVMTFQYIQFLQALSDLQKLSIMIDPSVFSFNPSPFDIVTFRRFGIVPQTGEVQEHFNFKAAKVQRDGGRMMNLRYIEVPAKDPSKAPLIIFVEGPERHSVIIEPAIYDEAVRVVKVDEKTEKQLIIHLINNKPVKVLYVDEEDFDQARNKVWTGSGNLLVPVTGAQTPHSFTIQSVLISGISCELKAEHEFRRALEAEPATNFYGLNQQRLSAFISRPRRMA
ncbi:MAG: hypothetical protein LJE70_00660 [Chromatiaceae bacterium]|nr:hypothetical protein [Chromatiaceae bacterium]